MYARAGVHRARTRLDLGVKILIRDLGVSFKGDAVEDRVLDHPDNQHIPLAVEFDIGKEAGVEQRLQRAVDAFGIPRIAGLHEQIGTHRLGLDALNALDANVGDRAGESSGRCGPRVGRSPGMRDGGEHPSRHRHKGCGKQDEPTQGHALWNQPPPPDGLSSIPQHAILSGHGTNYKLHERQK